MGHVPVARGGDRAGRPGPRLGVRRLLAILAGPWPTAVSRSAVLATLVFAVLAPRAAAVAAAPIAVAAALVGLPHGAADAGLLQATPARGIGARGLGVAYLIAALATAGLVRLAPVPTFLALLVLAVVHFGAGEVEYAREVSATRAGALGLRDRLRDLAAVVAAGGLVVGVPFAVHRSGVDAVLRAVDPSLPAALPGWLRWSAVAGSGACAVVVAAIDLPGRRIGPSAELALLAALGLLAPPVLAFGVFFGAWHSLRHTARLLALPSDGRPPAGSVARNRPAAGEPPVLDRRVTAWAGGGSVLVATGGITALVLLGTAPAGLVAASVTALLALTVPHTAVVWWLDRRSTCPATIRVVTP